MATSPALYRKMPYETLSDFEYLGMINEVPMTLIGRPTLPANNYAELVKWLEENKGKINLANAGLGAASHLCGLLFMQSLKLDMTTVPYKGTGPAMTDLLGGQVDIMCDQTTNTTSQIEGGKVKAFAVTTMAAASRRRPLSKLPTLDSQGLKGFNVTIWHALYAPKGTPAAAVEKVNKALQASLKDADFIKKQEALGAVVITDGRGLGRAQEVRHRRDHQVGPGDPRPPASTPTEASSATRPRAAVCGPSSCPQRDRDGHRAVVDQVHLHVGAELAALDLRMHGARGQPAPLRAGGRARARPRRLKLGRLPPAVSAASVNWLTTSNRRRCRHALRFILPASVGEDAQRAPWRPACRPRFAVGRLGAHQHQQARADRAGDAAGDLDARRATR